MMRKPKETPWEPIDFALVEAFEVLELETCKDCGYPIWVCRWNVDGRMGVRVDTVRCEGLAETEKWFDAQGDKKPAGTHPIAVYELLPFAEEDGWPTRKEYYEKRAK